MRSSALAWGLLLVSNLALAADEAEGLSADALDADFLEFLGLWETDQGEWLPPTEVAEMKLVESIDVEATVVDVKSENVKEVVDEK